MVGTGTAGSTGNPGPMPTIDQTGMECGAANQCLGSYKCWAATGSPPGICVPSCSAAKTSCPDGYSCDTNLNACTKPQAKAQARDDGGCSVGQAPYRSDHGASWLGLSLSALWIARRRRKPSSVATPG